MNVSVSLSNGMTETELDVINAGLIAYNAAEFGPSNRTPLTVVVRDNGSGNVLGGLIGLTLRGWLFIQSFWLPDSLRGKGLAAELLDKAEDEASSRSCHSALLDTFNPAAQRFYERQGYSVFGEIKDFPIGKNRVFMQKALATMRRQN